MIKDEKVFIKPIIIQWLFNQFMPVIIGGIIGFCSAYLIFSLEEQKNQHSTITEINEILSENILALNWNQKRVNLEKGTLSISGVDIKPFPRLNELALYKLRSDMPAKYLEPIFLQKLREVESYIRFYNQILEKREYYTLLCSLGDYGGNNCQSKLKAFNDMITDATIHDINEINGLMNILSKNK